MNPDNGGSRNPYKISGGSFVGRSLAAALFLALILFLPAGDLFWTKGWLFLFVSVVTLGAAAFYLWRVNPEIFSARRRIQPGTKRWDRILLGFLFPAFLAVFVVAGYDDGRFARSDLPRWSIGCGYLLYVAGIVLTTWAEAVNRFFEPGVRIQTERGHRVIDTGPYAIVRHPGYMSRRAFLLPASPCRLARCGRWSLPVWLQACLFFGPFGRTAPCGKNCPATRSTPNEFGFD